MAEPIAIIGMGCRFPQANNPEELWSLLNNGRDAWGPVPPDRWNAEAFHNPDQEGKEAITTVNGYFLAQDITHFDARFFECRPHEAHTMDPQQRIILETTYEALEHGGLRLEDLRGSDTAVFVGVYGRDYDRMGYKDLPMVNKGHTTGAGEAIMSNRISYLLDLKGASMTIDTGCSGSMVALHQACLTLKAGESRMAIVGGTELLLHPDQTIAMSQNGMINPDGKCYVFDSRGSGYARGEGVGTVVLKCLSHAIEDGDTIHAIVRNSALNQDGRTAGIALPNSDAQAALMEQVYATAGLDPNDTLYVEAHGTGTQAGDKAEFGSISRVFCKNRKRNSDLWIGSVKANIGHLEAASGVAGLIKGVLVLKKKLIPPHINLMELKPSVQLDGTTIKIPNSIIPLVPANHKGPIRISINSFGYGGTNCHVILDAAPDPPLHAQTLNGHVKPLFNGFRKDHGEVSQLTKPTINGHSTEEKIIQRLFVLSASSESALQSTAARLQAWLTSSEAAEVDLKALSLTLGLRRSQMLWRYASVASSISQLSSELDRVSTGKTKLHKSTCLTFVFTGQGAQWYAMGRELICHSKCFRNSILQSDQILRSLGCQWSLEAELMKSKEDSRISESELSQPSTTAIQIAIVDLLAHSSVTANRVIGHSSGEIAAAYAAGVLNQHAAMEISYRRGLCSALARQVNKVRGSMMAVGSSEESVSHFLDLTTKGLVKVACVNSPESVTLSGDEAAIDELQDILKSEDVFCRKLQVDVAYHSHHMEKIADEYLRSLGAVETGNPLKVEFYSSVSGTRKISDFGASYWTENLVSKVRFAEALQEMTRNDSVPGCANLFVEIGPHAALAGPVRQTLGINKSYEYLYKSVLERNKDSVSTLLRVCGSLWGIGYPVGMRPLLNLEESKESPRMLENLPSYPWDHGTQYWYESRLSRDHRLRHFAYHDLLGVFDVSSTVQEPRWRYHLNVRSLPWLKHHVVDDTIVFPGAGYVCMAIEAVKQLLHFRGSTAEVAKFILRDVVFSRALTIPEERADGMSPEVEVQLVLSPSKSNLSGTWDTFSVLSLGDDGSWSQNCSGTITTETVSSTDEVEGQREARLVFSSGLDRLDEIRESSSETIVPEEFYTALRSTGNDYGPTFASLTAISAGAQQGHCAMFIPDVASWMPKSHMQRHVIHPATLDCINHLSVLLFKRECSNAPLMVTYMQEINISTNLVTEAGSELIAALQAEPKDKRALSAKTWVYQRDYDGGLQPVVSLSGVQLRATGDEIPDMKNKVFARPMTYNMIWKPDIDFSSVSPAQKLNSRSTANLSSAQLSRENLILYVALLAHKFPHMSILELNSGNDELSRDLLRTLSRPSGPLLKKYDATDKLLESFDATKASFKQWEPYLSLKKLDISTDPSQQGFENGSYDLIIAANDFGELEAESSISHARKLLRVGGRLIFPTPGSRKKGGDNSTDNISKSNWDEYLRENSFGRVDSKIGEIPGMTICIALEQPDDQNAHIDTPTLVQIVTGTPTAARTPLSIELSKMLANIHIPCRETRVEEIEIRDDTAYIILDSAKTPILSEPSLEAFDAIRSLLTTSRFVLWVSYQDEQSNNLAAFKGMISGLARVVRRENEGMRLVTINVERPLDGRTEDVTRAVFQIAQRSFWPEDPALRSDELELAYSDGVIQIPRVINDDPFAQWVDRVNGEDMIEMQPYHQADRPLKLEVGSPGLLHSLRFVDDSTPNLPLSSDEIQIQARAYGVNFRDVFIALGQMLPGLPMVGEIAGIVTAVGSGMHDKYKIGDKVMGTGAQPFASEARVKGLCAHAMPQSLGDDFGMAASIPLVFLTAYHALVNVAALSRSQTVLIHAASGGVGQAAIQIAKSVGAVVFATISNTKKRKLIMDRYNIPETHIFSSRSSTFKQGIMRLTNGEGVDVILNSIAGETLGESWDCIAKLGTFVEIGKADMYKRSSLSMVPFDRSAIFAAVDMSILLDKQPQKCYDMLDKMCRMMDSDALRPVTPLMPITMDKIESSFRLIATRKHTGKVILEANHETQVKCVMNAFPPLQLNSDGAYIVAGGLGDIGKRLARLLTRLGAGHVITLSRRDIETSARIAFESEIESLGGQLHILKCDITNKASVEQAATYCKGNSLRIRGIIHGGMVLRDHPFELMELQDWNSSLAPKVQGTINLHDSFQSEDLDFFITLSSISAILGKTGQANYAAANAFQDAFVMSHKGENRTHYMSLNLGAVEGSDAVTSVPGGQQELLQRMGALMMTFDELYKLLEYGMSPQAAADACNQSIVGFDRQSMTALGDEFALTNPFFSMIPYVGDIQGNVPGPAKKDQDVGAILKAAKTLDEAEKIILHQTRERFAIFLDRPVDEIDLVSPVQTFGLDSLVAIELRNYMSRTFQVGIQTAEITDASGLQQLAKLLASRSKLVDEDVRKGSAISNGEADKAVAETPENGAVNGKIEPLHNFTCCKYVKEIAKQPLPDLDEALRHLQKITEYWAETPHELQSLETAFREFAADGSVARRLYSQLKAEAHDPNCENWAFDHITDARWLRNRLTMFIGSCFLVTHPEGKFAQSQAERAALLCKTVYIYKQDIDNDNAETHWWQGTPSCTSGLKWLFSTSREPKVLKDEMRIYADIKYCVALSRGHLFKVILEDDGKNTSLEQLKHTFQAIIDKTRDVDKAWTGILTTDDRDSWAQIKQDLRSMSPKNQASLQLIDEAAFVICLDDGVATTNEEQVNAGLLGDAFNRWFDKTLQFIVTANGRSGCITNHTMIHGLAVHHMNQRIQEAISTHSDNERVTNGHDWSRIILDEHQISINSHIEDRIDLLRKQCLEITSLREYSYHRLRNFGSQYLLSLGVPVKGALRLTFQLASRLFFGWNPPASEPFSLSHYHKGKAELFQQTLPAVTAFCDAVLAEKTTPASTLRELFLKAAQDIHKEAFLGPTGNYPEPLMIVLETGMWPADEPKPALFKDPVYRRSRLLFFHSDQTDDTVVDSARMAPEVDSIWLRYNLSEKEIRCSIVGERGGVKEFQRCLDRAAAMMKSLLSAGR